MGEFHPAEKKVVVEFSPRDMQLTEAQQLKMKKLLGPRYNPETDVAKISCEQFEHQAQNKRYLADLVEKLVTQAKVYLNHVAVISTRNCVSLTTYVLKDPSDMFDDIPLDTRHHPIRVKPKFPREWRMTEERRKFIEDTRQRSLLLDQAKEESGNLISGKETIEQFFAAPVHQVKVPEYAKARLNKPPTRGRLQPSVRRM